MRVLPYRSKEDHISGVVITFFDVTKRKKIEEELRSSEERLRLLMETAKDYVIFTQDIDRRVNTWNSGAIANIGDGVKVTIADEGIGIKDEVKPRIFERFFRVSGRNGEKFSGMGLGLYISADIIERHGGKIGVENGTRKGSVFYFVLPYNRS